VSKKKTVSKKRIQSLHLSDGTFVIGEVIDVSPGAVVLRQPLTVRRHPAIAAVYLVRYQPYGEMTDAQFSFLTSSVISYSVPDRETVNLYKAGVKGLRAAEKADRKESSGDGNYTIVRPGENATGSHQLEPVESSEPNLEELRRTTVRTDD